jgi:hypothetical protein
MGAASSFETSILMYHTVRHHIQGDSNIHSHYQKNLISYTPEMEAEVSFETFSRIYQTVRQHIPENNNLEGFEVLTAVILKSSVFWDITPCSPLSVK